jgi:hypothetical protein
MPDQDPLRTALATLREAAVPHVRPPGVEAVRATVRRRQARRSAAALVAVVAVVVVLISFASLLVPPPPVLHPTPTPSPTTTPTGQPTPSTTPSESGSAAPSAAATGTNPVGTQVTATEPCNTAPSTEVLPFPQFRFRLDPARPGCGGEGVTIRVFWAVYTLDPDGVARLSGSQVGLLSANNPVITMTMTLPRQCSIIWFVVEGNDPIVGSFAAPNPDGTYETIGAPMPYTSHGGWVLDVAGPCPPPASEPPSPSP